MLYLVHSAVLLLSISVCVSVVIASDDDEQCMPMSSMTSISFEPGTTMTRRRGPNVPKLNCMGNCPSNAFLASAQCTQTGVSDNGLPSWKCKGLFPASNQYEQYALGSVRVQCEGCNRQGDPNVVKGSCALTYSVLSRQSARHGMSRHSGGSAVDATDWIPVILLLFFACGCYICATRSMVPHPAKYTEGVPVAAPGAYYAGGGGGGFGTGMLTGYLVGDTLGRLSAGHGGYGGYGGYGYDGGEGFGGYSDGGSWGSGGGFGGSDSV